MNNYYVFNKTTEKIELHFDKDWYLGLGEELKKGIKSNYLFSKYISGWVSRAKFPNLYRAEKVAEDLGLEKLEDIGDSLSFTEKQDVKVEKAEKRAERYKYKSEKAYQKGNELQAEFNSYHGDVSFFTQPNMNTSRGRAFTNYRNKVCNNFVAGIKEHKKAEYYANCTKVAKRTAEQTNLKSRSYLNNRIKEANAGINKINKNIATINERINKGYYSNYDFKTNEYINVDYTEKQVSKMEKELERQKQILQNYTQKLEYYQNVFNQNFGDVFTSETIQKGDIVVNSHNDIIYVINNGKKNITPLVIAEFTEEQQYFPVGVQSFHNSYLEIRKKITDDEEIKKLKNIIKADAGKVYQKFFNKLYSKFKKIENIA